MKPVALAACIISAAASAAAAQEASLQCGGTEPFWSLTITRNAMWLTVPPDDKRINLVLVKPRAAVARLPDQLRIYQTRRADGKGAATLVVMRSEDSCSDGMSDRRYAYDAVYFDAEQVYQGCCSWSR